MTAGALAGIGDMSRERFAELYIAIGEEEGALVAPQIDEARFVVIDQGQEHELAALYERFLALPTRSRRYFLVRALRGAGDAPMPELPSYDVVRGRILPIRTGAYLNLVHLDDVNRGREPQSLHAHFCGELHTAVVVDDEDAMAPVTARMLDAWSLGFDRVRRDALDNLSRLDAAPLDELSPGFWMGPWDDGYAASRILQLDVLRVCNLPIVAVPNRDTLLVADGRSEKALSAMVSLIESTTESAYQLSRRLFRLDGDSLHPWTLPASHRSAMDHRRICVDHRVRRYSEQQWLLQEAVGDDWYVATAELDETKDGALTTRALWTEGVSAVLPEVDRLHLLSTMKDGTSSRLVVADFADVCDLDGVLERTEQLLPRWRTRRFPTDAELAEVAVPVARDPGTAKVSGPGIR